MTSVSVVMATYNRERYLSGALDALLDQDEPVEIVVVDDSSTDGTAALLESYVLRHPGRVLALRTPRNSGPAVARNLGWHAGAGPWVAFTDDDCVVTSGWAAALRSVGEAQAVDLVQGRTLPDPRHSRDHAFYRQVECTELDHRFETCNLLVARSVLEDLGGFDESYSFAGEDADFGWRALEAGRRVAFASEALVHHAVRPMTLRQYVRLRWTWGQLVHFYARHPEARFLLHRGLFHRRAHVKALVLLAALVVASLISWWLALVVYVLDVVRVVARSRGDGRRWRTRLLRYGVDPITNLVEVARFAAESVRYRTVVL